MIPLDFQAFFSLASHSNYFVIFIIMVLEGPTITTAASFAASLGYFNIFIIFILSVMGDLVADALHYYIGHFGRRKVIDKYGYLFKVDPKMMRKISKHYHSHMGKTLFLIKMTPLSTPGLLLAGASKLPLRKFVFYSLLITFPRTLFFTGLGFFFGFAVEKTLRYFQFSQAIVLSIIILAVIVYFLNKAISRFFYKAI